MPFRKLRLQEKEIWGRKRTHDKLKLGWHWVAEENIEQRTETLGVFDFG